MQSGYETVYVAHVISVSEEHCYFVHICKGKAIGCVCHRCLLVCPSAYLLAQKNLQFSISRLCFSSKCLQTIGNCLVYTSFCQIHSTNNKDSVLWVGIMSTAVDHTKIPLGHVLYTTWDDSFNVCRAHYTVCICEKAVCSYHHGSACIATWCTGYVLYRAHSCWLSLRIVNCSVSCILLLQC